MAWTYRVVKRVIDGDVSYGIHEAYDDGHIETPHSISEAVVVGDTVDDLASTLDKMKVAFAKPVLEYDAFASRSAEPEG